MRYYEKQVRENTTWLKEHQPYEMIYFTDFYYKTLNHIIYKKKTGYGIKGTYNDCIIMADTETSKHPDQVMYDEFGNEEPLPNHVVAWTISIRAYHMNIVTLYGSRPSEFITCLNMIRKHLKGEDIYIYWHNMPYDWFFLRAYCLDAFGKPVSQLNIKSHYPINIRFPNNIVFKDSLILAGCKLEKWAQDLDVEHQKAVGSWDYDKIRNQDWISTITEEEKTYIENDTLAGVECIDALMLSLDKNIYTIPATATGIPREEVRHRAEAAHGHQWFKRQCLTWDQFIKFTLLYHGGYSHANRYFISDFLDMADTEGWDFNSSYPYCLLAFRYPAEAFIPLDDPTIDIDYVLRNSENYAYIFKITFFNVRLKDDLEPMPALQSTKCQQTINLFTDNGRVLSCGYCWLYMCEQDLHVIKEQYEWDDATYISEVECAKKDYLPRWFTDYVYECYEAKCELKDADPFDPVKYALSKARVNSLYGLTVQRCVRRSIKEVTEAGWYQINEEGDKAYMESGDYVEDFEEDLQESYKKYCNKRKTVLPYQVGTYCTAYAFRNLFELGKCVKRYYKKDGKLAMPVHWYYSDTDSCYSDDWDYGKIWEYNNGCKERLKANNYGPVIVGDKEYWLGVAAHKEPDDTYTEFKVLGSKRYAGRSKKDGELHITVAGVPKKGAECLEDDLNNFEKDFIFDGNITGKLTHYYIPHEPFIDEFGNEVADSIDLQKCDYHLDAVYKWEFIDEEEEGISFVYGEEDCNYAIEF